MKVICSDRPTDRYHAKWSQSPRSTSRYCFRMDSTLSAPGVIANAGLRDTHDDERVHTASSSACHSAFSSNAAGQPMWARALRGARAASPSAPVSGWLQHPTFGVGDGTAETANRDGRLLPVP
jgi:hypothetical protein